MDSDIDTYISYIIYDTCSLHNFVLKRQLILKVLTRKMLKFLL